MPDLTLALEELRDFLPGTQHEISILENMTRELTSIVDFGCGPGADALIRRHLAEIDWRRSGALARQRSIACMLEECGRERQELNGMKRRSSTRLQNATHRTRGKSDAIR